MYDPIQNQISQQQIFYLIGQMEGYHANNSEMLHKIRQAFEINTAGNVQAAASAVYVFLLFAFCSLCCRIL